MVVSGSPIGSIYHLYTTYSPCLLEGEKCYLPPTFFLGGDHFNNHFQQPSGEAFSSITWTRTQGVPNEPWSTSNQPAPYLHWENQQPITIHCGILIKSIPISGNQSTVLVEVEESLGVNDKTVVFPCFFSTFPIQVKGKKISHHWPPILDGTALYLQPTFHQRPWPTFVGPGKIESFVPYEWRERLSWSSSTVEILRMVRRRWMQVFFQLRFFPVAGFFPKWQEC